MAGVLKHGRVQELTIRSGRRPRSARSAAPHSMSGNSWTHIVEFSALRLTGTWRSIEEFTNQRHCVSRSFFHQPVS
jgi:hypothetical protein